MLLLFAVSARRAIRIMLGAVVLSAVTVPVTGVGALAAGSVRSSVLSPTAGGTVPPGVPLIITGDAGSGEGSPVDAVEVSVDGGASWQQAIGNGFWSMVYLPTGPGELEIVSRASAGTESQDFLRPPVRVTVGAAVPPPALSCPCPLQLPEIIGAPRVTDPDQSSVEVGVRFQLDRDGFITGVRVRRDPFTDPITGHLWGPNQGLLASTAEVSTPMFGWAEIPFAAPVPVQAGQTYIASYFTAAGHYDSAELYFGGALVQPPFRTIFDEFGGGGIYQYSDTPAVPIQLWNRSNYWVAPVFAS
jgi:hypothetical protein